MDSRALGHVEWQLRYFFHEAQAMDRGQIRRLRNASRHAPGRLAFQTHPQVLALIASGAWTPEMDRLARQVRVESALVAQRLCPLFGRRAVTRGLVAASMAILTDSGVATTLPADLRAKLIHSWTFAQADVASSDEPNAA